MQEIISGGALTTFALGAVSGYSILRYRLHLTERSSQLNDHLKDIEKLVDAALSVVGADGDVAREKLVKLSLHHAIASRLYPKVKEICHGRADEYQYLMLRLFALVTADEKDSLIQDAATFPDGMQDRTQEIVMACGELTNLLRLVRQDSLSVGALLNDLVGYIRRKAFWFYDTFLVP